MVEARCQKVRRLKRLSEAQWEAPIDYQRKEGRVLFAATRGDSVERGARRPSAKLRSCVSRDITRFFYIDLKTHEQALILCLAAIPRQSPRG